MKTYSTGLPVYESEVLCTAYAVWDKDCIVCLLEVGLIRPRAWEYMQGVKEKDSGNSYLGWAPDPRESEWGSWRCYCCLTLKATVRMFYRILAIKSHQKLARKPLPPLVSLQWHCRLNWTFCCLAAKKYLQSTVPFSLLLLLLLSRFSRVRLCATP